MSILINGCPKHGNHALLKAVELLGQNGGTIMHYPHGAKLPDDTDKHLFVYRDPRNGLISWMRQRGSSITDGTVMAAIRDGEYMQLLRDYVGWMKEADIFKISFEELISDEKEHIAIACYLGVPYLSSAFANLPGLTITWTGRLSDFRTIWTSAVAAAWRDAGGDDLVEAYGYEVYAV